jgi:hypothetical protein
MSSLGIQVDIRDAVTPLLNALPAQLAPERVGPPVGQAVANLLRAHFARLDQKRPNALGGDRTHFYARAAKNTSYAVAPPGVTVSVNSQGIAQRYFGGVIKPVKAKKLAIPARAESYGKSPREFSNLEVAFGKRGPYALVERASTDIKTIKRKSGELRIKRGADRGGGVMFWLVDQVNQAADPTVLPGDGETALAAFLAARDYVRIVTRKGGRA